MKTAQQLDVLIINPSALGQIYQSLSRSLAAIEPPIWAGLIANHLRIKNKSVDILDCEGLELTITEGVAKAGDYSPKLTVVVVYGQQPSASTQNMYAASLLCTKLKETYPDRKILLIGGHCSALPARTLLEEKADFVCQGEGPATVMALLECNLDDTHSLAKVPGLWYRDEGVAKFSGAAKLIAQDCLIQELPGIAWDLLPMKNYRAHNWHCFDKIDERQPYASLYTSLGCPFQCTFCCINAPYGANKFRYWDPEFTIKQFDTLADTYGVKNIKIADEMFVLKEAHFMNLCKLLKERGHGFNIWAYSRIDTIKESHLDALKEAGVNWLALGIESKSKFVRDGVQKGRFGDNDIYEVVRKIKAAGINVIGNYIFGLPDDNYETMTETLEMALDLNCEMGNFYSAMAYPGSKLYEWAVRDGQRLPNSWLGYSQHSEGCLPLPTKFISGGEVLGFRDRAWDRYFSDPRYLNLVKSKFGQATHDHIAGMTKIHLRREHAVQPPPSFDPMTRLFTSSTKGHAVGVLG